MTKQPLTENQELLREFVHYGDVFQQPWVFLQITAMLNAEGMDDKEIDELACVFEREKETGVYVYPPPKITQENMHLHMCEPDDSWMYAD